MGKWCLHASLFIFDWIIIKVAGNQDRHKSWDEFDFGPFVPMAHLYVFWNEILHRHIGLRWATCLSLRFSTSSFFVTFFSGTGRPRRLKLGTHVWTVGRCIMYTGIRLLLLFVPLFLHFFFLSNFQHWIFSLQFSRELWSLEDWKLVHTWTVGRCIMYTGIRRLLLIHPFLFLHFPFQFST